MRVFCPGLCLAVIAFAGCSSSGSSTVPGPAQNDTGRAQRDTRACPGSRIGQAQCDVLLEPGGAHATYAGWSAAELEQAYDLPVASRGKGQIIAVVDAYDNPDVGNDLAKYRSGMGLPSGTLDKYNQDGQMSNYPEGSPGWGVEIDLDVEMASASCPNCTIFLIEADSDQWSDLEAAEAEAVKLGATIITNSYSGSGGSCSYYSVKGIEYVATAGDSGLGIYQPAACDSVVSVGGTELEMSSDRRGYSEIPWPDSGGGCASSEKKPWWQRGEKFAKGCHGRLANDISAVAVDVAEYDSYEEGGWITVDGTSVSAPFCGGVFGLAENSPKQDGGRTFWVPAWHHLHLYKIGGVRYSDVGGWGSPKGIGAF